MPSPATTPARTIRRPSSRRLAALACVAVACVWASTRSVTAAPTQRPLATPGCPHRQILPGHAVVWAMSHSWQVYGYGMPCNPNVPWNPVSNPTRSQLALLHPNLRYHPVFNPLVWRCGCR